MGSGGLGEEGAGTELLLRDTETGTVAVTDWECHSTDKVTGSPNPAAARQSTVSARFSLENPVLCHCR